MNLPANGKDNFDVVEYSNKKNIYNTKTAIQFFEAYIGMDVFKHSGITYTEFKNMTMIEQEMCIIFISYKTDISNIDVTELTTPENNNHNNNQMLYV